MQLLRRRPLPWRRDFHRRLWRPVAAAVVERAGPIVEASLHWVQRKAARLASRQQDQGVLLLIACGSIASPVARVFVLLRRGSVLGQRA